MNDWGGSASTLRLATRVPKTGATVAQCEDAFALDGHVAAISDGASTQFESRRWARLLVDAFIRQPPFGRSREQLLDWVDEIAAEWVAAIPWTNLNVFEEMKAENGSAATLTGVRLDDPLTLGTGGRWRCLALGDSCLFHVSGDRLVVATPLARSADFDVTPALLSTRRVMSERFIDKLVMREGTWLPGDELWLLTDAIAKWFLEEAEHGRKPWQTLAALDEQSLWSWVAECRAQRLMRDDDVTVLSFAFAAPDLVERLPISPPERADDREPVGKRGLVRDRAPVKEAVGAGRAADAGVPPWPSYGGSSRDATLPPGRRRGPAGPTGPRSPDRSGRVGQARPPQAGSGGGVRRGPITRRGEIAIAALALIAAFVLGYAVHRQSRPVVIVKPVKHGVQITVESEARRFIDRLMTFQHGNLAGYETALTVLSTQTLAASLPRTLGLGAAAMAAYDSAGQLVSIAALPASGNTKAWLAVARQTVTSVGTGRSYTRTFLIKVVMVRSRRTWLAAAVELIPSPSSLLPTAPKGTHVHGPGTTAATSSPPASSSPSATPSSM